MIAAQFPKIVITTISICWIITGCILKAVAKQLRDPESECCGKEETILIWFADREFPWLVTVEAEAFR